MPRFGCVVMDPAEYHKMAAVEDDMWFYQVLHAHVNRCLSRYLSDAPVHLLDAGCGTGGMMRRIGPKHPAWRWTGVDNSPLACRLARERCAAEVVEADLTALPFSDGSFAAVTSTDVLYHIDDDRKALAEMARVLCPGGLVVVNVPAHPWLWSYHDVAVHGRRRYSRRDLEGKLLAAGLELIAVTHWNALLLPLIYVRRRLLPPPKSGSDVHAYPRVLNNLLKGCGLVETAMIRGLGGLPAGSSLLAVAKK